MIAQWQAITVYPLTRGVDSRGNTTTTLGDAINTGAYYIDRATEINIDADKRTYQDEIFLRMRFTPLTKAMAIKTSGYTVDFRTQDYRIQDAVESPDRLWVTFRCYRVDPSISI